VADALCAGLAGGATPTVLVKGSRGSAMDRIVKDVLAALPAGRGDGDAA
jgi:UDP-N-acetylmuramyl pentapeptide synthase